MLQHPSDKEEEVQVKISIIKFNLYDVQGVVTYLEIGPNTRVRTNIIPSADRVEYAEVNHAQPQTSVKNDIGKFYRYSISISHG